MRRVESCLTTQLAPVTHYNWRLQSSRDEIVWLIDVRIPWIKFVPTTPLLSYAAHRQDLFQPVHCQCSELDMTAPPHEKVATLMPLGELVLNMGGPLTITMAPHPGWPAPFQKHSHSVTHNRGDQVKANRKEWQPIADLRSYALATSQGGQSNWAKNEKAKNIMAGVRRGK